MISHYSIGSIKFEDLFFETLNSLFPKFTNRLLSQKQSYYIWVLCLILLIISLSAANELFTSNSNDYKFLFLVYTVISIVYASKTLDFLQGNKIHHQKFHFNKSINQENISTVKTNYISDINSKRPVTIELDLFKKDEIESTSKVEPIIVKKVAEINYSNRPKIKPGPGIGLKYLALRYVLIHQLYKYEGVGFKYIDNVTFYRDIEKIEFLKENALKIWYVRYKHSIGPKLIRENMTIINLLLENNEFIKFPNVIDYIKEARAEK